MPKVKTKTDCIYVKVEPQLVANLAQLTEMTGHRQSTLIRRAIQEAYLEALQNQESPFMANLSY